MKVKDLKKLLENFDDDSNIYFEEDGHNTGGESQIFPLAFSEIFGCGENEVTIRLIEN